MFLMSLPLLCAIIGALIYALAANPKAAEMGRLLFACGVLATLLAIGMSHPIKF